MNQLETGQFFGQTNKTIHLNGITLTDTEYTHEKVDWHYHQNAYFTFILQGNVFEGNKKETYTCTPGSLLFHNWQEPHYNIKPKGFTRGFHIEIKHSWFNQLNLAAATTEGSLHILDPGIKLLIHKIFKETKTADNVSNLSIEQLLLQVFAEMNGSYSIKKNQRPVWVKTISEIINNRFAEKLTLNELAAVLNIHPVHLCRDFSKYFHCTLGEYIRKTRIEKSLCLLHNKGFSLADIAFECGFADSSHFLRCFKDYNGLNPSAYRKLLVN